MPAFWERLAKPFGSILWLRMDGVRTPRRLISTDWGRGGWLWGLGGSYLTPILGTSVLGPQLCQQLSMQHLLSLL